MIHKKILASSLISILIMSSNVYSQEVNKNPTEPNTEPVESLIPENEEVVNEAPNANIEEMNDSQYFIVDGSIDIVKELAEQSQKTQDPAIAYETARFAKFISDSAVKAKMEGLSKIVIVNVPSYTLYAINLESGISEIESKVIVGKKVSHSRTPMISTNIKSITLNPTWTPPISVIKRSIYPSLGKKGGYADKHELVVEKDGQLLPLSTPGITRSEIQGLRIYQPAGINNSLGRIRFNTDNNMNIYLHDTNQRYLFQKDDRAFSLGCVRVQDWQKLASWIAGWDLEWLNKNVEMKTETGDFLTKTYTVNKVSVSIGYYTVRKDKENVWVKAPNIYNIEN